MNKMMEFCNSSLGIGLPIHYKDLRHPIVIREENPQGSIREVILLIVTISLF